MPSSLHIPGLPYVGSGVLGRLTSASAFRQLPRSPLKFRKNARCRGLPSTPPTKLPRRIAPVAPPAPRQLRWRSSRVASVVLFPSLVKPQAAIPPPPPPRVPSPPRYCVWETPSMSKNGVRRALLNRVFDPPTPPPSRIPRPAPVSFYPVPTIPCPSAPRKKVGFADPLTTSYLFAALSPVKAMSSRLALFRTRRHVAPPPPVVSAPPSAPSGSVNSRSASPLRSILVRSRSDKVRAKKGVRFGHEDIREVDYWIDRKRHVFKDGGLWKMGSLQGWRVTALPEPNEDGETEKYMTMWGHDHSSLYYHTNMPPCPHHGCSWGKIVELMKSYLRRGIDLRGDHEKLMILWSDLRRRAREQGHRAL